MQISRHSIAAALALLAMVSTASAAALPPAVEEALRQAGIPESAVAAVVVPVSASPESMPASGEQPVAGSAAAAAAPRLSWRSDVPMNPASVMKLVTTYAALDLLGPDYFWKTRVFAQGPVKNGVLRGNLLIQGSGDPKLVVERLQALLQAVQDAGVRHIAGDILLDRSVFRLPSHDPGAFDGEPLRPYNAGPDGLLVNFSALVFKFFPDPKNGTVRVESEPPLAGVALPQRVAATRGACGDWRARLQADFSDASRVRFAGRYPLSCGEREWSVAYPDPDQFAPRVFEAMWRAAGGSLDGRVRWQQGTGAPGHVLATGYSFPLAEIIADINEYSNNVMAQQLFLTLSATAGAGSFAASQQMVQRWWQRRLAPLAAPVLDNGSGLSRAGRISAESLAALLQLAARGNNAGFFERSLPVAGINGTLRHMARRNPESAAIGNARLKTGSLRDVAAVAGYAWGVSGRQYVVVGLVNGANAEQARPALDRLIEWVVRDR